MDVNDFRIAVTLSGLVLFLALVAYTWSRRRRAAHDEAALLPFIGESLPAEPAVNASRGDTP